MTKKKESIEKNSIESINKRLDALIRVIIETLYLQKDKFNEASVARILKSVGLTPTEIAKIMGKQSATDISPYLYAGKTKKSIRKRK